MKRGFLIIIGIYLIVGTILVLMITEKPKEIKLLTLRQNYLRLMTEDEELVVSVFIDSDNSFITDKTIITNASLSNELNEIAVNITDIEQRDEKTVYQSMEFYIYSFKLRFNKLEINNLVLDLEDCYLNLDYINGESFNLLIGNVYLDFKELTINNHLDYEHLVGITEIVEDKNYLVGIYIKFENLTKQDLIINKIFTNTDKMLFDVSEIIRIDDEVNDYQSLLSELENYNHLGTIGEDSLELLDSYYYLVPIIYQEDFEKIYRFPLFIAYTYNNQDYILETDDLLVFNDFIKLDDYVDDIREYFYYYQ